MPDVFDRLLGQPRAVAAMRHYVRQPVHAYLLSGPGGAGVDFGVRVLAAALECPRFGCDECDVCRRVLDGSDANVVTLEREGLRWLVRELHAAERIARRTPLGEGRTIVVIPDVQLADTSGAALLKILEEPPPRAVFLLTADQLPPQLVTVLSRCLEIPFAAIGDDVIAAYLEREGADPVTARAVAAVAEGDLRRAMVLVRDDSLSRRLDAWRSVPDRLNGTSARAAEVVEELRAAVVVALQPLSALQEGEMERATANAKALGLRAVPRRREMEDQFKREQRRFRVDDLRLGLGALAAAYRERLLEGLDAIDDGETRGRSTAEGAVRAIGLIDAAARQIAGNVDEQLALGNLVLGLSTC